MTKFTKEQLQQIEAAAKEVLWPVVWSEKKAREHFCEKITPKVVLKLARIALASLEAEPVPFDALRDAVAEVSGGPAMEWSDIYKGHQAVPFINFNSLARIVDKFRAALPAPVSVPDAMEPTVEAIKLVLPTSNPDEYAACIGADMWNACRAAILQGAEPVTTAYKLPANTPCKDAPEHIWLQTAGVWPENGEFSELTWCSDSQHKDDTLYVRADVVTGNSPVIPDGWVMVPVEPTPEMINSAMLDNETGEVAEIYELMLAAAPQQEAKP